MKIIPFIVLVVVGIAGCNDARRTSPTAKEERTSAVDRENVDRDNTAVNERDRAADVKTPIDQNENQKDIAITANIRKRVVNTKMSVNAQNVKIITQNGKVTLRGPVKTADEKKQIEEIAHDVAGADNVDSQLEVEQQP